MKKSLNLKKPLKLKRNRKQNLKNLKLLKRRKPKQTRKNLKLKN